MNRAELAGGAVRVFLVGAAWARLMFWRKGSAGRLIHIEVGGNEQGEAVWKLSLTDNSSEVFSGESDSLQGVTIQAVTGLGKAV